MSKILCGRALALGVVLSFVLAGCGATKLTSQWRDREIAIDGADADWYDAKIHIDKTPVDIGIINDGDYLYVCLTSADRTTQMQIARTGFTLWFDPGGGKGKKLGVRFPRGMRGPEMWTMRDLRRGQGPDPGQLETMFDQVLLQGEMEILGPKKKQSRRLATGRESGPDVRAAYDRGRLVYELRMPLAQGDFALGVENGATVGVGFTTPERSGAGRGGRPSGGLGGGGMGGGLGGRRGMGGVANRSLPVDPLQIWTKVELAQGPGR